MPYFDYTDDDHTAWLPRDIRDEEDLELLSLRAEAQVIAHYTISTITSAGFGGMVRYANLLNAVPEGAVAISDDRAVCLRGFAEDAGDATPALQAAMMRAIADQIRWLRTRDKREPDVEGEAKGKASSKQYGVNPAERVKICQDAHDWLRLFDVTPPLFAI